MATPSTRKLSLAHGACALAVAALFGGRVAWAQPAPSPMPADPAAMAPAPAASAPPSAAATGAPAATAAAPAATGAPAATAAAATGEPAPSPMPADPAAVAPPGVGTPVGVRDMCMAAIRSDEQWNQDLIAKLVARMERDLYRDDLPWAAELRALVKKRDAYDVHAAEAKLIATNQRHVIMAYAALWLAAIGFLVMQWRKQKALREQLEALRRDLDAAVKGAS